MTFHSVSEAVIVMLSVVYAMTGGVILQWWLGYNFSVAVWVGYIALYGVAVQTGVVMVVYLHEALDRRLCQGGVITEDDIREATLTGSVLRLRPKLMTVSVTIAALVPIMWSTGVGADVMKPIAGINAPICQDGRSGGFTELLARAEVSHDSLIDFPSEKAFKASDDVPFRPSIRPASDDIVDRRLVIAHTDHDGSMEGGVRLSVAAPIEAVSTGGHPGGGGDGTRAAELGKGGFRANPLRVIPEDN